MTQKQPELCMTDDSRTRRSVDVQVTILSDQGKGDFKLSSADGPRKLPIENEYVLNFDNKQNGTYRDGFEVRFRLASDALSSRYRFPSDLDDAIWVKILDNKGPCPASQGNPGGVFDPVGFEDNGRTLVVDNPNKRPQLFGFALRFVPVSGAGKSLTYDPIGNNQNGQMH